jgi:hypothetical protein
MMPYKFNSKLEQRGNPDYSGKLDQETGLYYYGARYYQRSRRICLKRL